MRLFGGEGSTAMIGSAREFKEAYATAQGDMDPQDFKENDPRTKVAAGLKEKKNAMRKELQQAVRERTNRLGIDPQAASEPAPRMQEEILGQSSSEEATDARSAMEERPVIPDELSDVSARVASAPSGPAPPSAYRMRALKTRQARNKKKDNKLFGRFSKKHRAKKLQREFASELEASDKQ
jgi:hypothetical protein